MAKYRIKSKAEVNKLIQRLLKTVAVLKAKPSREYLTATLMKAFKAAMKNEPEQYIAWMDKAKDLWKRYSKIEKKQKEYWRERSRRRREVMEKETELWKNVRFDV